MLSPCSTLGVIARRSQEEEISTFDDLDKFMKELLSFPGYSPPPYPWNQEKDLKSSTASSIQPHQVAENMTVDTESLELEDCHRIINPPKVVNFEDFGEEMLNFGVAQRSTDIFSIQSSHDFDVSKSFNYAQPCFPYSNQGFNAPHSHVPYMMMLTPEAQPKMSAYSSSSAHHGKVLKYKLAAPSRRLDRIRVPQFDVHAATIKKLLIKNFKFTGEISESRLLVLGRYILCLLFESSFRDKICFCNLEGSPVPHPTDLIMIHDKAFVGGLWNYLKGNRGTHHNTFDRGLNSSIQDQRGYFEIVPPELKYRLGKQNLIHLGSKTLSDGRQAFGWIFEQIIPRSFPRMDIGNQSWNFGCEREQEKPNASFFSWQMGPELQSTDAWLK